MIETPHAPAGLPLLLLVLLMAALPAQATDVGGSIVVDTRWTAAQSPYEVLADIGIDNDATLTIDPGVIVRMAPGTRFTVNRGALLAKGSAEAPIVFTSGLDRAGTAAAAGDWGPLQFADGTIDASTGLDFVQVKYGRGIAITAASPSLDRVSLLDNAGAAISIDLQSSPIGNYLEASGNDINGILVPPGTVTGQVRWGLAGIPYVVAEGIVRVGQAAIELDPPSVLLMPGTSAALRVVTADPAPAGGRSIGLRAELAGILTVPAHAVIPAGATTAEVTVTALGPGQTRLIATDATLGDAAATVEVREPPSLTLTPSTVVLVPGSSRPVTLTASAPALLRGLTVTLDNPEPTLFSTPATVNLGPGQSQAVFNVSARAMGGSSLTARAPGHIPATAQLLASAAQLTLPAAALVAPGLSRDIELGLSSPAPAGGMVVALSSSAPAIAAIDASISVPAGATAARATLTGIAVGSATIAATATGYQSAAMPVRVEAATLQLTPAPAAEIPLNVTQRYAVESTVPAPLAAIAVTLASSDPATVELTPTTADIPAGAIRAGTNIDVRGASIGSARLSLTSPGLPTRNIDLAVGPAGRLDLVPTELLVGKGLIGSRGRAILFSGADLYHSPVPVAVALSSADPAYVAVPASVAVQGSTPLPITGVEITAAPVEIDLVPSAGYAAPATRLAVRVVTPELEFAGLWGERVADSARQGFRLCWRVDDANGIVGDLYPESATDIAVDVAITATNPPGVVDAIYDSPSGGNVLTRVIIPARQTCSPLLYAGAPGGNGNYRLTAAAAANGAAATSALQTIATPTLSFGGTDLGLRQYVDANLPLRREIGAAPYAHGQALTVALSSSDPAALAVPADIVIPADQSMVAVPVRPVRAGNPVTIGATAAGYDSEPLTVTVAPVIPLLRGLESLRAAGSARDEFQVCWQYWSASLQDWPATTAIELEIDGADPAGIVSGFYDAASGGNPLSRTEIVHGQQCSPSLYVASPSANGGYRVVATAPDGYRVSVAQTVGDDALVFPTPTFTLARGFATQPWGGPIVMRTVLGREIAPETPLTVNLVSSDPARVSVPAQVVIPGYSAYVQIPLTADTQVATVAAIAASAPGMADASPPLTVSVVDAGAYFNGLNGLQDVDAGERDQFRLCLASATGEQWPLADIGVDLYVLANPPGIAPALYDDANAQTPLNRWTFSAGQIPCVDLYSGAPTGNGQYAIRVSGTGIATTTSPVQYVAAPSLGFRPDRLTLGEGLNATGVLLERWSGRQNSSNWNEATVALTSSDPDKVQVPASVTIPHGALSVEVPVTGLAASAAPIAVSASAAGYDSVSSLLVSVQPTAVRFVGLAGGRTVGGGVNSFGLCWAEAGQTRPVDTPIDLAVVDQTPATVVAGLYDADGVPVTRDVIPANQECSDSVYSPGRLAVAAAVTAGSYRIAAAVDATTQRSEPQVVDTPKLQLWERDSAGRAHSAIVVGKGLVDGNVTVQFAVNGAPVALTQDATIVLACADPAVCATPASVVLPAGSTGVGVDVTGLDPGNTRITANAGALGAADPLPVTVALPGFGFELPAGANVGDCQGYGARFDLYPTVAGAVMPRQRAAGDIAVTLSGNLVSVPASVSIGYYGCNGTCLMHTPIPGTGSIDAGATGFVTTTSPAIPVTINGPGATTCWSPS